MLGQHPPAVQRRSDTPSPRPPGLFAHQRSRFWCAHCKACARPASASQARRSDPPSPRPAGFPHAIDQRRCPLFAGTCLASTASRTRCSETPLPRLSGFSHTGDQAAGVPSARAGGGTDASTEPPSDAWTAGCADGRCTTCAACQCERSRQTQVETAGPFQQRKDHARAKDRRRGLLRACRHAAGSINGTRRAPSACTAARPVPRARLRSPAHPAR